VTGAADLGSSREEFIPVEPAERADLIETIAYALKHKCFGLSWKRGREHEDAHKMVAAGIVEHMELCRLKVFQLPSSHGTHKFPGSIKALTGLRDAALC
jgi:hypothetical protein